MTFFTFQITENLKDCYTDLPKIWKSEQSPTTARKNKIGKCYRHFEGHSASTEILMHVDKDIQSTLEQLHGSTYICLFSVMNTAVLLDP